MEQQRTLRAVICAVPVAILTGALILFDPFAQPLAYHDFADQRIILGIPNFFDVTSNLTFLVAGGLGLYWCLSHRPPGAHLAWTTFFLGFVLVSIGSVYYHWAPSNDTLVWDRLTMTVGFAGVYVALLTEYVGAGLEKRLLPPALMAGAASVLYWHWADDLRPYFALQATVFTTAAVILAGFENAFRQRASIASALACYATAIVLEQLDRHVFALTGGAVSGHTLKHVMAGLAGYWAYRMLKVR